MAIPVVSLFCGCGGLDLGFVQAGFDVLLALDIDPVAVNTYNLNLGHGDAHADTDGIAKVSDLAQCGGEDIIQLLEARERSIEPRGVIGGPPCQPFSTSNVHAKTDDPQRALPGRFATILKTLNERYELDFFVFENVRGITFRRHRSEFARFRGLFEKAGFVLHEFLLDAQDFGVAQKRPRVFVVGLAESAHGAWRLLPPKPDAGEIRTVEDEIRGLPEPRFFQRSLRAEDIPYHPNHWTMQPKSRKFRDGSLKEGESRGRSFRVLSWSKPSWAVAYGNREIHIHPSCERRLSVLEAMRLQGFPDDYQLLGTLSDQVRQVCDAVPPAVGAAIGTTIRLFLEGDASVRAPRVDQRSPL